MGETGPGEGSGPERARLVTLVIGAGLRLPASRVKFRSVLCDHVEGQGLPSASLHFSMRCSSTRSGRPAARSGSEPGRDESCPPLGVGQPPRGVTFDEGGPLGTKGDEAPPGRQDRALLPAGWCRVWLMYRLCHTCTHTHTHAHTPLSHSLLPFL